MFDEMAKYANSEHSQVIWDCLVGAIDALLHAKDLNYVASEKLKYLVQLTEVWTEYKQGYLISDASQLQKV